MYVCKRFKVTMEMVSGKDSEWILNLVKFYLKHRRKEMQKLERAEVNPKKRVTTCSYDSSSDVFKLNLVYKDQKGVDQELKWIVKVTRSDVNETANVLLKHEKYVFSRLVADLICTVKQKSACFLEGARVDYQDLLHVPEYIYDETTHTAHVTRNVLVVDNLEERKNYAHTSGPFNLAHFKTAVRTVAKFHAVGICHKQLLWQSFALQAEQVLAKKTFEDVELEGEVKVMVGKEALFSRYPILNERLLTMQHLISNRQTFLDMYQEFLKCFPEEGHLLDIFDYIRLSADELLRIDEDLEADPSDNHLDSISIGVLETRSFLFVYESDEDKENKKRPPKVTRSHSDRTASRKDFEEAKSKSKGHRDSLKNNKEMPAKAKCPKIERNMNRNNSCDSGVQKPRVNKFLQKLNKAQDDTIVPPPELNPKKTGPKPDDKPVQATLVNAKYVTYQRITNDIAVMFFTSADTTIRRYYLINCLTCYVETLGIALNQLGVNTDAMDINLSKFVREFQTHLLYGFLVGVLVAMANTSVAELNEMIKESNHAGKMEVDGPAHEGDPDVTNRFIPLSQDRKHFLLDMMRDVASYVESKDFELGLPITNFTRYHELWSMLDEAVEEDGEED